MTTDKSKALNEVQKKIRKSWKFEDTMYVKVYELAKSGLSGNKLSKALGIDLHTLQTWKKNNPAFADAISEGRKNKAGATVSDFVNYVYGNLDTKTKKMWDKIQEWEKVDNGVEMIEAMLEKEGTYVRMSLWVHAFIHNNFNLSAACKTVNISVTCFRNWCDRYPDFAEIVQQMHLHKKNFFESALIKLVGEGDSPAVIFANKTYNRDRGYNEKVELDIKNADSTHLVDVSVLNLPPDLKRRILDAYREYKEKLRQDAIGSQPPAIAYDTIDSTAKPTAKPTRKEEAA
jgi:hypothetical protein